MAIHARLCERISSRRPRGGLTEAERKELARVLRDAKDAWVHSPYPVSESMYLADAAAAWFAKRDGTVKP